MEGVANAIAEQGEITWAAQLWGATECYHELHALPRSTGEQSIHEQRVKRARSQSDEQAFLQSWAQGRTMTLEQVLARPEPSASTVEKRGSPSTRVGTYRAGLTRRQAEVLQLVVQGLTDVQIADRLVISPNTVSVHLQSVYGKLGVSSRTMATRVALEKHLV
jgi:DNA-binding NarL/FixJ family response regulator